MGEQYTFYEEQTRATEQLYMTDPARSRRVRLLGFLNLKLDDTVLDLGSGPGFFTIETAEALGQNGAV